MSSLDELITKAKALHSDNHSPSQIADELSLSVETITWLLTQEKGGSAPKDVHIDWTAVSSYADMLYDISVMLLRQWYHAQEELSGQVPEKEPTVAIGVAHSGIPIATLIAAEADLRLTMYYPAKHAIGDEPTGSMSGNFSSIQGEQCIIIDDVITTGNTMNELVQFVRDHGAQPIGICVIFDKRGIHEVDGVPVHALFRISRID